MTQAEWLLVSAGLTAYLVLYNALLYRMRPLARSAHRWMALWALCSFAYQAARFRQITATSPAALHQGDWVCLLAGTVLIPLTVMMLRDATGDRSWAWAPWVLWLSAGAIAVVHVSTSLFITRQVGHYRNFAGHEVAFSVVGPLYAPALIPLSLLALACGLRAIPGSPALDRREKVTWLVGAFAYQILGGNDLLLFSGLTARLLPSVPGQSLFEFGLVGFAAALTLRMARGAEQAKAQLEQLVAQRTCELSEALGRPRRRRAPRARSWPRCRTRCARPSTASSASPS